MSGFWSTAADISRVAINVFVAVVLVVLLHDIHERLKAIERYIKGERK